MLQLRFPWSRFPRYDLHRVPLVPELVAIAFDLEQLHHQRQHHHDLVAQADLVVRVGHPHRLARPVHLVPVDQILLDPVDQAVLVAQILVGHPGAAEREVQLCFH